MNDQLLSRNEDVISLVDILWIVVKRKALFFWTFSILVVLVGVFAYLHTNKMKYIYHVTIVPAYYYNAAAGKRIFDNMSQLKYRVKNSFAPQYVDGLFISNYKFSVKNDSKSGYLVIQAEGLAKQKNFILKKLESIGRKALEVQGKANQAQLDFLQSKLHTINKKVDHVSHVLLSNHTLQSKNSGYINELMTDYNIFMMINTYHPATLFTDVVPMKSAGLTKTIIVILGIILSLIVALGFIFVMEFLANLKCDFKLKAEEERNKN